MPVDNYQAPIEIHELTKNFGAVRALDGLELTVRESEVHGFLGPNGAGKSTTIRILLGVVKADGGTARLLGGDPWTDAVELHRQIAYVPGDVTLWPNLTGGGGFLLYIQMHETPTDLRAVLRDYARDMVLPALELYTDGLMTDSHMYDAFLDQADRQTAQGESDAS